MRGKNSIVIKLNLNELDILKKEGGKLFFKKEAEDQIVKLLDLKEKVEEALNFIKNEILKAGQAVMGVDFKGIIGKEIKVLKRAYGDRFEIADENKAKDFIYQKVITKIDLKKVENFIKSTGKLPDGIVEKERNETLSIIKIKNEKN